MTTYSPPVPATVTDSNGTRDCRIAMTAPFIYLVVYPGPGAYTAWVASWKIEPSRPVSNPTGPFVASVLVGLILGMLAAAVIFS